VAMFIKWLRVKRRIHATTLKDLVRNGRSALKEGALIAPTGGQSGIERTNSPDDAIPCRRRNLQGRERRTTSVDAAPSLVVLHAPPNAELFDLLQATYATLTHSKLRSSEQVE
jgi:hypothetical protein